MAQRILLAGLLVVAACSRLPPPHLPQVEQAARATHGGGERYRKHQRCLAVARTPDDLVACMREEGYRFIAQHPDYPSPECWEARRDPTPADLPPHCFEHDTGTTH